MRLDICSALHSEFANAFAHDIMASGRIRRILRQRSRTRLFLWFEGSESNGELSGPRKIILSRLFKKVLLKRSNSSRFTA